MNSKIVIALIGLLSIYGYYLVFTEVQIIKKAPITSWQKDHRADCAVVLTGGQGRVREGLDLLTHKQVRKLIISGVYAGAQLREIYPQWPFYGDIHKEDVILEKRSKTTYGNAQQSLPLVEALHCRDIVLITSNIHMRRAHFIFKTVFPHNFPIYPRSIIHESRYGQGFLVVWTEAIKSLFYDIWAY